MSCIQCVTYALPACPSTIHLVDSGLNEAVNYHVHFTDKFNNVVDTLIEAPFPSNDIIIPIDNNPDIPTGLFTQYSGSFKMELYDSTNTSVVPFNVNGVLAPCVFLSFKHYEGVIPTATIFG